MSFVSCGTGRSSTTQQRTNAPLNIGNVQLSLLLGVTPENYQNITSDNDIVGGGLFSRFNIIGVERDYGNVDTMFTPDSVNLEVSFLPRVRRLINDPACIPVSNKAKNAVKTWFESVGRPAQANIQLWRRHCLLASLRSEQRYIRTLRRRYLPVGRFSVGDARVVSTNTRR